MTFEDFKSWVRNLPEPPDKAAWWELKARLDAVESPVSGDPTGQLAEAAVPGAVEPAGWPSEDAEVEDCPPAVPEEDWRGDGGVTAEAVKALRKQQKRSFSLPEAENRP